MFKHIMVPVDLGHADRLDRALKVASDLATHYGSRVTYVGVTMPQPSSVAHNPKEFGEKLARFAAAQTETSGVDDAGSHPIVSHDPSVDLDRALVDACEELGCDLIVMGSHIPRAFDLRSHGAHLASLSHHSVMLVRDEA
ncbi:universal stress protein [Roseibacterium sp. SDUM158017]|uniref:universal stress protein n=1 Tax=Roseicyclus salinarum TaxID=3036773 RepID=UPI002415189C|nr:universal stress protein [Roseibacterium sp. SDUM158017]MDG4647569.1 universal stress protein [Roseibacterium sp. SDUM158017]